MVRMRMTTLLTATSISSELKMLMVPLPRLSNMTMKTRMRRLKKPMSKLPMRSTSKLMKSRKSKRPPTKLLNWLRNSSRK